MAQLVSSYILDVAYRIKSMYVISDKITFFVEVIKLLFSTNQMLVRMVALSLIALFLTTGVVQYIYIYVYIECCN